MAPPADGGQLDRRARLAALIVHVRSSTGESTDHDHSRPSGSLRPAPVQNGGPQRSVQLNSRAGPDAPSMVKMWRWESIASSSSSSTEIACTSPSKHLGTASGAQDVVATGR